MRVALGKRNAVGNASLAVAFFTLLAIGTDLFVVSPLLPAIAQQYRVVPGVAGNAVTLFSLAYMLGAPAWACSPIAWDATPCYSLACWDLQPQIS
jgi:predicted MFS family arabinose efflux permease